MIEQYQNRIHWETPLYRQKTGVYWQWGYAEVLNEADRIEPGQWYLFSRWGKDKDKMRFNHPKLFHNLIELHKEASRMTRAKIRTDHSPMTPEINHYLHHHAITVDTKNRRMLIQPKIEGERLIAWKCCDHIGVFSRDREVFVDSKEYSSALDLLPPAMFIEGVVTSAGVFTILDVVCVSSQENLLERLSFVESIIKPNGRVEIAPFYEVHNEQETQEHERLFKRNFSGAHMRFF